MILYHALFYLENSYIRVTKPLKIIKHTLMRKIFISP